MKKHDATGSEASELIYLVKPGLHGSNT